MPEGYVIHQFPVNDPGVPAGAVFPPNIPLGQPTPFGLVPFNVQDIVIQKQNQLNAQLLVKQAIIAPQLWPAIRNAYLAQDIAATTVEAARRDVLFGVAQIYYGAASLRQNVDVSERQLALTQDHERDARVRYQAGTTAKVALLRAEIDRASAEQDLKRAQNAYLGAKESLATLILRPAADFEVVVPASPAVPEADYEAAALRDRPDVREARQSLELAERTRNGYWTQYAPSLGAFGQLNWANLTGFTGKELNWAIGLAATWTIFDGGLREANLREASAKAVEASAAEEAAQARARDEVRHALLDLDSARANKAKAREQVDLARENQRLVEVNYKAGAATYIESTDAAQALRNAELNFVAESLNADLAALRLLKATGAFGAQPY